MFLKQSTAATLRLGPFVDASDGATLEDGLTINAADVLLSKAGGALAAKAEATAASYDAGGMYAVALGTADTGTLGRLDVVIAVAGARPVHASFCVLPANAYDSLVAGSDLLDVNTMEWRNVDPSGIVDFSDQTGVTVVGDLSVGGAVNLQAGLEANIVGNITGNLSGTVGGVTMSAIKAKTDLISSAAVVVTSYVDSRSNVTVVGGTDSTLTINVTYATDLSSPTSAKFYAVPVEDYESEADLPAATAIDCTLSYANGVLTATVPLTAAYLGALETSPPEDKANYAYNIVVVKAGAKYVPIRGSMTVLRKIEA